MNRSLMIVLGSFMVACSTFEGTPGGAGGSGGGGSEDTTVSAATVTTGDISSTASTSASIASSSTGIPIAPTTVRVIDTEDAPVADVVVFANDADGNLIDEGLSDAAGVATLEVPAGSSVHVAREAAKFYDGELRYTRTIDSLFDAEEGTDATFRVATAGTSHTTPQPNQAMRLTVYAYIVNLPSVDLETTNIALSCGGNYFTTFGYRIEDVYRGCAGEDTFSIFAMGYDEDDELVVMGKMSDIPFEPGQDRTHQVQMFPVNAPPTTILLNGSNVPNQRLYAQLRGEADRYQWSEQVTMDDVQQVSLNTRVPALFDRYVWTVGSTELNQRRGFYRTAYLSSVPAQPIHVGASELAAVRVAAYDKSDPRHPEVTLAVEPGPHGDFVAASITWGDNTRSVRWRGVAAPASQVMMRVPALPQAVADWVIQPGETMDDLTAQHVDTNLTASALDALAVDVSERDQTYTYEIVE